MRIQVSLRTARTPHPSIERTAWSRRRRSTGHFISRTEMRIPVSVPGLGCRNTMVYMLSRACRLWCFDIFIEWPTLRELNARTRKRVHGKSGHLLCRVATLHPDSTPDEKVSILAPWFSLGGPHLDRHGALGDVLPLPYRFNVLLQMPVLSTRQIPVQAPPSSATNLALGGSVATPNVCTQTLPPPTQWPVVTQMSVYQNAIEFKTLQTGQVCHTRSSDAACRQCSGGSATKNIVIPDYPSTPSQCTT